MGGLWTVPLMLRPMPDGDSLNRFFHGEERQRLWESWLLGKTGSAHVRRVYGPDVLEVLIANEGVLREENEGKGSSTAN